MTDKDLDNIQNLLCDSKWTVGYRDRLRAAEAIRHLRPYKAELLKIAAQVGEPADPFAIWERLTCRKGF